jgi:hypothetical protein
MNEKPTLILERFWWALEELKNLPDIAGQMMGDFYLIVIRPLHSSIVRWVKQRLTQPTIDSNYPENITITTTIQRML